MPVIAFGFFLLARTWRVEMRGWNAALRLKQRGERLIVAIGHGDLLPTAWVLRGAGVQALISEHFDGELIARFFEAFGFRSVRGSATRGGARALLKLLRTRSGDLAVTPDGPQGPRSIVKAGITFLASRAGMPIVIAAYDADLKLEAPSWDRFKIPLPFARVVFMMAPPRWISPEADAERLELERRAVEADLHACEQAASAVFGRPWIPPEREVDAPVS